VVICHHLTADQAQLSTYPPRDSKTSGSTFHEAIDLSKVAAAPWKAKQRLNLALQLGDFTRLPNGLTKPGVNLPFSSGGSPSNLMTNSEPGKPRAGEPDDSMDAQICVTPENWFVKFANQSD